MVLECDLVDIQQLINKNHPNIDQFAPDCS